MPEPGWKVPNAPEEDCWVIICPVDYCSANPGNPCMNPQGRFTKAAHKARWAKFDRQRRSGSEEKSWGPGSWSKRPNNDHVTAENSDSPHEGWSGIGYMGENSINMDNYERRKRRYTVMGEGNSENEL